MSHYINPSHLAAVLGGDVSGNNVTAPGPNNHDKRRDRSMSILVDPDAPDGFLVKSHSSKNTDIECKDYVRAKLGLPEWKPEKKSVTPHARPKIVCHYVYHDADGEPYLRVTRMSDKSFRQSHWDIDGWASGKPKGDPVPYRLQEIISRPDEPIWLVEGEKDADNLAALGLLATTAPGGGGNFPLTPEFGRWFDGRSVIAIMDNDATGLRWRERVTQAIADVVHISMPAPSKDVSDWLSAGGTVDDLWELSRNPPAEDYSPIQSGDADSPSALIIPTPFQWIDPSAIPPREWLYGDHLIRKFVSLTVSPGGLGKSSLALVEALAMTSGRELLHDAIHEPEPLRVWYWNGEDPQEETRRRVVAAAKHYGLKPDEFAPRLFTDSGRDQPVILGEVGRDGIVINEDLFQHIEQTMIANRIDVFMADPFVSAHRMGENDNNAIDAIVKRLGTLADRTNAAVEIVHHVRKPSTADAVTDVNDARGASALIGGVRSARVLNVMSVEMARDANIPDDLRLRHFSVSNGKANMTAKSAEASWRFLESVCLENQTETRKADNVGVVTYYKLPESVRDMADLSNAENAMRLILSTDDMVRHWSGKGPKPKNWLGHRILDDLNIHDETKEPVVQKLIRTWLREGIIVTRSATDKNNRVTVLTMADAPFTASEPNEYGDNDPF